MRKAGLQASQPGTYRPRTSDGKANNPSPNLLKEIGQPEQPLAALAGDFTYIRVGSSFVYLAVILDLYTRKILGWSLREDMKAALVVEALTEALNSAKIPANAIFHSDRGSQYSADEFRKLLHKKEIRQSMSARGNPYDNAQVESFFSTLKRESLDLKNCGDIEEVRREVFKYIHTYYNNHRLHSSLGYVSPEEFEQQMIQE